MKTSVLDSIFKVTDARGCWDEIEGGIQFYNVEFIADFGVFKTGEKYLALVVMLEQGIFEGYIPGLLTPSKVQTFTLVPTAEPSTDAEPIR